MHWTQVLLAAALVIYLGAFVAIMVTMRRSTGASPMGHDGGHRLAALLNKVAALLLLLTAISYPLDAQSVEWFGRIALLDHPVAQGLGVVALVLTGVCIIWGEVSLGRSFRVALPESKQPLVTHGIYRFVRNPLALLVDLLALGVLLLAELAGADQPVPERGRLRVEDPNRGGLPARGPRHRLHRLLRANRPLPAPLVQVKGWTGRNDTE